MNRRQFLGELARMGVVAQAVPAALLAAGRGRRGMLPPQEASYWTANPDGTVTCTLCPHHEILAKGELGRCRTRRNVNGRLLTLAVGQPCVVNQDPIEKNPLAHALPGRDVFAVAHAGCNLHCHYCQNWQFSQSSPEETENLRLSPEEPAEMVSRKALAGVSFTYTEGVCHIEFNLKVARAARAAGGKAFLCTAGYIEKEPFANFLEELDAVTVTVKGQTNAFYKKIIGAPSVRPVLRACRQVRESGTWLEIATLICPGLNDSEKELRTIAHWIADSLGRNTPWHLERFTPKYKMANRAETPVRTMEMARDIGREEGLRYVYICNVAPHEGNHTYCHRCGKPVIKRLGFKLLRNDLRDGRCPHCRARIAGVWT